jgi:iron complex transport system ATP-binding protein
MTRSLTVHHLSHSFGDRPVLDDVSFSVGEGEFFIVIGPNASGKTTLIRAISGGLRPQKGDVEILGRSLRSYSGRGLARTLALVPQTAPADIPFTVAEVVLMGRSPHLGLLQMEGRKDRELAERAMAFTRVEHLADRKLDQLSGGERQRVLIARAVCQEPRIILLDEPTASLDLAHQVHVMDLMEDLKSQEGMTVIMVSHDLNLACLYADRLLLMKEGCVMSIGTPCEVVAFDTLEETYGCVLLVDENPLKEVPRVTLVPGRLNRVP